MGFLDNLFTKEKVIIKSEPEQTTMTMMPNQTDIPVYNNADREMYGIFSPEYLYAFGLSSDTLRTIANALRQEVTRRGLFVDKMFESKCLNCQTEYDYEVSVECPNCKSKNIYYPEDKEKIRLEKIIKKANDTQSLIDIVKQWQDDYTYLDNAYLIFRKEYYITDGKITGAEVISIHRGDPCLMRKLIRRDGQIGYENEKPVYINPTDRTTSYTKPNHKGTQLYLSTFAQKDSLNAINQSYGSNKIYFLDKEVYHNTLYTSSKNYGVSPLLSLYMKVNTLIRQDKHILRTYSGDRSPSGILTILTASKDSLQKAIDKMREYIKKNPNGIPTLMLDPLVNNKGKTVEYIDFMKSLSDLQFIEQREEYRKVIGAFYGVSPIFQNDTSSSGGLNNERLQVVVTNRAIENAQEVHNQMLEKITEQLGITGWVIRLKPSEERDEMNTLLLEEQKLKNALLYSQLGYKVEKQDDGDFNYIEDDSVRLSNQLNNIKLPSHENKTQNVDGEPFGQKQ